MTTNPPLVQNPSRRASPIEDKAPASATAEAAGNSVAIIDAFRNTDHSESNGSEQEEEIEEEVVDLDVQETALEKLARMMAS